MYPNTYFGLFPPFPRKPTAFVAMSFDPRFDSRWSSVLEPALANIRANDTPLKPFRVDLGKASDAILTEILQHIGDATVVVADITAIGEFNGRPIRNANVLYEVGIAHAARQPEEVVLFRSDSEKLDFDIAGVRVHNYDPDSDPSAAREKVIVTVIDSLSAREERVRLAIRWAAERLTLPASWLVLELRAGGKTTHPRSTTMGEMIGGSQRADAIRLLLDLGAIKSEMIHLDTELLAKIKADPNHDAPLMEYSLTTFGHRLAMHLLSEMGVLSDDVQRFIRELPQPPSEPRAS